MIRYVLKQRPRGVPEPKPWVSEPFEAADLYAVRAAVLAGFLQGEARWAESVPDGYVLFGVDEKGRTFKSSPELPATPPAKSWRVRYVHKVSPRETDVLPHALPLPESAFADSKALGKALRGAKILMPGARVRSFRVKGDRVVVFPTMPGMTTYWHAIILTSE